MLFTLKRNFYIFFHLIKRALLYLPNFLQALQNVCQILAKDFSLVSIELNEHHREWL
jgi:hypothetical protein